MVDLAALLQPEARQFVATHLADDPRQLMLQRDRYPSLPIQALVGQIQARQKAKTKIPTWFSNPDLLLPPGLPMEQCSSEQTAKYKASLVQGTSLVDLTGGAGVDTYFMSRSFKEATYVEQSPDLCAYANHNFKVLKDDNVKVINQKAEQYLSSMAPSSIDMIYLDPARRVDGQKVFKLEHCSPNAADLLPMLLSKAKTVLLKAAPWLDVKSVIEKLKLVDEVHIVAVDNECKEVLYLVNSAPKAPIKITCVNLLKSGKKQEYSFTFEEEQQTAFDLAAPQNWLYEPNAAIMKGGAFKRIAETFDLRKLAANTHLYTSIDLVEDFPGRIYSIEKVIPYKLKELRNSLPQMKANLAVRNFPISVAQIRKKTRLKDGGEKHVFACRSLVAKPILIIVKKYKA